MNRKNLARNRLPAAIRSLVVALLLLPLWAPHADAEDWSAVRGVSTVTVTTESEDGTPRETTIWLVVVGHDAYVRTGNTKWGDDLGRNPNARLRVGTREHLVRAVPVRDPDRIAQIQEAYQEKYGWQDTVVGWFPGAGTRIFQLESQTGT